MKTFRYYKIIFRLISNGQGNIEVSAYKELPSGSNPKWHIVRWRSTNTMAYDAVDKFYMPKGSYYKNDREAQRAFWIEYKLNR